MTNTKGIYRKGIAAEFQVSLALQKMGWKTAISPGSRGPADIMATKGGSKWFIQVKVRKNPSQIPLKPTEESKLFAHSDARGGIPVVALVTEIPGGLLMVESNIRDSQKPFLIRGGHGNFVAIELENNWVLFLFDLRTGSSIEP